MKIAEFINFTKVYSSIKDKEMPFSLSYKVAKIQRRAQEELNFYQEQARKIFNKYGEKDEKDNLINDNGSIKIKPEFIETCTKELLELEDVTIDDWNTYFTIEELEPLQVTSEQVEYLLPFIK